MSAARAIGLLLGVAADGLFGDPRRGHPVAAFGKAASEAERWLYRDRKSSGVRAFRAALRRRGRARPRRGTAGRRRPVLQMLTTGVATWACSAARPLPNRAPRSAPNSTLATSPPPATGCPACAAATPTPSTRPVWPAPPSNPSPRTPPTRSSRRCCGAPSLACPACSATARSTRSMPWSATDPRATSSSAGPPRASTTS